MVKSEGVDSQSSSDPRVRTWCQFLGVGEAVSVVVGVGVVLFMAISNQVLDHASMITVKFSLIQALYWSRTFTSNGKRQYWSLFVVEQGCRPQGPVGVYGEEVVVVGAPPRCR